MATKAELEAELAELREQLDAKADGANGSDDSDAVDPDPGDIKALLKSQGVDGEALSALWSQLSEELGHLPENKPVLTTIGAFGLGFVLGRMSKH